jgi:hypothetical protein
VTLKDTLGKAIKHEGRWVVTVYHPSYVLRVPDEEAKRQAFAVMVDRLEAGGFPKRRRLPTSRCRIASPPRSSFPDAVLDRGCGRCRRAPRDVGVRPVCAAAEENGMG